MIRFRSSRCRAPILVVASCLSTSASLNECDPNFHGERAAIDILRVLGDSVVDQHDLAAKDNQRGETDAATSSSDRALAHSKEADGDSQQPSSYHRLVEEASDWREASQNHLHEHHGQQHPHNAGDGSPKGTTHHEHTHGINKLQADGDSKFCQEDPDHPSSTLYMDGFHGFWNSVSVSTCLSYLGWWTMQSRISYVVAMLVSFGLSVCFEYVALEQKQQRRKQQLKHGQLGVWLYYYSGTALLGYLTMMIAMSYSRALWMSLLAGHMVGQYYFAPVEFTIASPRQSETPNKERQRDDNWIDAILSCFDSEMWIDRMSFPATARLRRTRRAKEHSSQELVGLLHTGDDLDESTTTRNDDDDIPVLRKRDIKS